MEAPNFDVCVVWCSDGPIINSQEYESFEIYAVTIKISMTEYHHWINNNNNNNNILPYIALNTKFLSALEINVLLPRLCPASLI